MDPLVSTKEERMITPSDMETMELLPVETPATSASSQIHRAAKDGSIHALKACLESNPNGKNSMDDREMAPLHYAAQCNRREAIKELLKNGADLNIRGAGNITPLHVAARYNSVDAMDILLSHNADVSIKTQSGCSPFLVAIRMKNVRIVELLLDKYPKLIEESDSQQLTALHWASLRGSYEISELLVNRGADIGKRTKDGSTPLVYAAESTNKDILPMLLQYATNKKFNMNELINGRDNDNTTPLFSAILARNVSAVQLLLDKGASVNSVAVNRSTPLHMAATNGDDKIVKLLLSKGARVEIKDSQGKTPLHRAAAMGCHSVIKLLVENNSDIEERDNDGRSPLLCAVSTGQSFAVKLLVNLGADIKSCDNDMRTGLHLSAIDQQFLITHMLVNADKKKLQSMSDFQERIPLHYAALGEDVRILQTLIENGSNCGYKDLHRATPLHLAATEGLPEHVELLLKAAPSSVHERDVNGLTALHLAALNKRWQTCDTLLKIGAQVDALDSSFQTPLFQASLSGSLELIELLLNHHANLDHTDDTGNTALHIAAQSGNSGIVKAFLDKGALRCLNDRGESCLDVAISARANDVIMTIVRHERWEEFIHVDRGGCYIMSKLIAHFPDAVTLVMDKSIKRSHHKPTDPNFSLTFDFQLLDPGPERLYTPELSDADNLNPLLKTKRPGEKRFFGLIEMVANQRKELLVHPLPSRLRRQKWKRFGALVYIINFCMHALFAGLLTYFIFRVRREVISEGKEKVKKGKRCRTGVSKVQEEVAIIILIIITIHLVKEMFQMLMQRLRYFTDLTNLFEFVMYTFSLIFIVPYAFKGTNVCTDQRTAIWNFGTTAVFMAYFDLIMLTRTLSFIGLYVTMFIEVFKTLLKVMVMCVLFLLAFSIVFFIIFREQEAFDEFGETVVKTMVMAVGELDYLSMLVDTEGRNSTETNLPLVPYPELSYIFVFFFVMAMPIVLMNLLVGLAVGDISAIQNHAYLSRIGRHVEFLTDIEKSYPTFLTRLLYSPTSVVYPGKINSVVWNFWIFFGRSFEKLVLEEEHSATEAVDPEEERYRGLKDELKEVKDRLKNLTQMMENQHQRLKSTRSSSLPTIDEVRKMSAGDESPLHESPIS